MDRIRPVLVHDGDRLRRAHTIARLATIGVPTIVAEAHENVLSIASGQPVAMLLVDGATAEGQALAAAIGAKAPTLPILAWTIAGAGADGVVDTLDSLVARVRPDDPVPRLRVAAFLGAEAFTDLQRRFAIQLADAIVAIDRADPDLPALLHRAGGLAGTLGYAVLADRLLAISEGDDSSRAAARFEARRVLHAITLDNAISPPAAPSPAG